MATRLTVAVDIGANLTSAFKGALRASSVQLDGLGAAINGVEAQSARLDRFKALKREVSTSEAEWKAATAQVATLARQLRETETPSAALKREFEQAQKKARSLKEAFDTQRASLTELRGEMAAAGQSTRGLGAQQKQLTTTVEGLRQRYDALEGAIERRDANLQRRQALRGELLDAAALGVGLWGLVKPAITFESAMADVKKVVNFDSPTGLAELGETLKDMATEQGIPLSPAELLAIAAAGGQLGIAARDLDTFVDTTAKMATAFGLTADEAGEASARLANIYQLPITEIGGLGDAINHLSDNTAAKAGDIVAATVRIGGTARQFGLAADEAAALAGSFIALGRPPEVASTAINALLQKLQGAPSQGRKFQGALEAIGLSAQGLQQAIGEDARGALVDFLSRLEALDATQRVGVLTDLFGMEHSDDVGLLTGSLDELRKAFGLVADAAAVNGSMQREFANRSSTTENQLRILRNRGEELAINLGSELLPAINGAVAALGVGVSVVADFAHAHPLLTQVVVGATAALILHKVAVVGAGYAWTFITGPIHTARVAYQGVRAAIALARTTQLSQMAVTTAGAVRLGAATLATKAWGLSLWATARGAIPAAIAGTRALTVAVMANPVGLIVGGIALAVGLLVANWDTVGPAVGRAWASVKAVLQPAADWIWDAVGVPITRIVELAGSAWAAVKGQPRGEEVAGVAAPATRARASYPRRSPTVAAAVGAAVAAGPAAVTLPPAVQYHVEAIHVHGSAGMDERRLAQEVGAELERRARRAQAAERGALHD